MNVQYSFLRTKLCQRANNLYYHQVSMMAIISLKKKFKHVLGKNVSIFTKKINAKIKSKPKFLCPEQGLFLCPVVQYIPAREHLCTNSDKQGQLTTAELQYTSSIIHNKDKFVQFCD